MTDLGLAHEQDGEERPPEYARMLAALWSRHRAGNLARVEVLEEASASARRGDLGAELRARAEQAAHQLAGSLGTFGFPEGTRLARVTEGLLAEPELDARTLSEIVGALRDELDGPGFVSEGDATQRGDLPLPTLADVPSSAPESSARSTLRALVVSDDSELGSELATAAVAAGAVLDLTPSAAAAGLLDEQAYDVVLVDLGAAGSPGLETLRELAAAHPSLPTVALAGDESFGERLDAARAGARGFAVRSLAPRQIVSALIQAHERQETTLDILAVDDDPGVLDALEAILTRPGLRLFSVADPLKLWDALEETRPDVVVLDVAMPGVDGIDLCRVIRADQRWQRLPILVLTARTDSETLQAAFAAGADDYVPKPFVGPELESRVIAHAERARLLRALAETDPLTGVDNRRSAEPLLGRLIRLASRYQLPMTLAILDLDRLKRINDTCGHAAGDAVLRGLGDLLRRTFRGEDVVGRWGGDEFVLGLYGMRASDAVERLAGLIDTVHDMRFVGVRDEELTASFSAGVAEFPADGDDLDTLLGAADRALYRAKEQGARVVAAESTATRGDEGETEIVVVEDDEVLRGLLVRALVSRGHEVRTVEDGAEAARLLGEGRLRARVVLLDLDLPGLDGLALLGALRNRGLLEQTRVIVLTRRSAESETLRALELGAFDHTSTPVRVPVLMQRIQRALRRT